MGGEAGRVAELKFTAFQSSDVVQLGVREVISVVAASRERQLEIRCIHIQHTTTSHLQEQAKKMLT